MRAQRLPKRLARRRLGLFRSPPPDAQRDVDESIVAMPVGNRIMVAANGTHAGGAKLEHARRRGRLERRRPPRGDRSEEQTSELKSPMRILFAVFCLEKTTATRITPTAHPPSKHKALPR